MAVDGKTAGGKPQDGQGTEGQGAAGQAARVGVATASSRRLRVGTNVLVACALVVGIVVVVQLIAYKASVQWDMTSSGVNSLGEGTTQLLGDLDSPIKLTSLYFETDREEKDQSKYRATMRDLLELYEATNRGRVSAEWINPLKDLEKFKALVARLREHPSFAEGIEAYKERLEAYTRDADGLDTQMRALVASELERVKSLGGPMGDQATQQSIQPIDVLLTRWQEELTGTRESVDAMTLYDDPQYSVAVNDLKRVYGTFSKALKSVATHAKQELAGNEGLSAAAREYLEGCASRYAPVLDAIQAEQEGLDKLEPLKIDNLLRQLEPTANAVLVETDKDAMVIEFASTWPPLNQQAAGPRAKFRDRAFKGEEKVTSAILRATHQEQTAVIFVRYGGPPLFFGGFMPGQPPAPYAQLKGRLEDANFAVYEWDLKSSDAPPPMDPEPTRTLYFVLKPSPPPPGPMGRPSQEPPFTDAHKQKVLDLLGDDARALFIAGWQPGPFGAIPASYEWNAYLTDTWGITVDHTALLVRLAGVGPGQYQPTRASTMLAEVETTDHDIVAGPQTRWAFPWSAALKLSENAPEGVELFPLVVQPKREGVWGIKNIKHYETQGKEQGYWTRAESDPEGPFTLAVAATKGDAKVVVVSSQSFAEDSVALAPEMVFVSQGIQLRTRNPGNIKLVINALHWLNDNTQFMNIGQPIDIATVEVGSPTTLRVVQGLTIVVWPMLALVGGGCVWWVRRR